MPLTFIAAITMVSFDTSALLNRVGLEAIEAEPSQMRSWDFVAPNEHDNHVFEACVGSEGVYVAVGVFRALNVAASGHVQSLVLLDHSAGIQIFNVVNLQLIARASDRFRYLSMLVAGEPLPELETQARSGALSLAAFLTHLAAHQTQDTRDEAWRKLGVTLSPQTWAQLRHGSLLAARLSVVLRGLLLEEFARYASAKTTIWGNDDRFTRIQEMVRAGRVSVVAGSLTGPRTMRSLARALRAQGQTVAALDISNVPAFVGSDRAQLAAMLANIAALPFAPDARLLFTWRKGGSQGRVDPWNYYAVPIARAAILGSFAGTIPQTAAPLKNLSDAPCSGTEARP